MDDRPAPPLTLRIALRALIAGVAGLWLSACTQLSLVAVNVPALFGDYRRTTDIAYGELPAQRLDVYIPPAADARPVVIFLHGGGWDSGDKNQYRFVGATLAEQNWIGVTINYRLYPAVKFPGFVDDAALAVQYVREHAREWGGDPQQIYLLAHSAGAHIAMTLALDPEFLRARGGDGSWLRGVIGLAGPYDFIPFSYDYMHDLFGPETAYPRSQPVNFARGDAPPLLLLHGLGDTSVLPRNTINLVKAMQQVGGNVEAHYYKGINHTDIIAALSVPARGRAPVLADIKTFIESAPSGRAISAASSEQ
ncbi:MAG: alpha/beta hydrolase [Spongiibacteraceae bacterium]